MSTAADLAIATQLALDAALDAVADNRPAVALVKFAAVEHLARHAAEAITAEARAHVIAEAVAACAAPATAPALLAGPFDNVESGDVPPAASSSDFSVQRSAVRVLRSVPSRGHRPLFPRRVGLVLGGTLF